MYLQKEREKAMNCEVSLQQQQNLRRRDSLNFRCIYFVAFFCLLSLLLFNSPTHYIYIYLIYIYIFILYYKHIHIYIYIYIYMSVCFVVSCLFLYIFLSPLLLSFVYSSLLIILSVSFIRDELKIN